MRPSKLAAAREFTPDRQGQAIQDNAGKAAQVLNRMPFAQGNLVEVEIVASANNLVAHGLQRKIRGWVECGSDFYDKVCRTDPSTADNDKFIDLTCQTSGGTVFLWFF